MEPVVLNDSAARGGNPHPLEHLHQRQDSKSIFNVVFDHGISFFMVDQIMMCALEVNKYLITWTIIKWTKKFNFPRLAFTSARSILINDLLRTKLL